LEHALPVVKMFVEDWNSREVWDGRDWAGRQREGRAARAWRHAPPISPAS